MEFHLDGFPERRVELEERFAPVASKFELRWRMSAATERKRAALFVSRYDHCLVDLLWRWRRDELEMDVVGVVSNHLDLAEEVERFHVPLHHVPTTLATKPEAARSELELLAGRVDLVVLARYMQVFSPEFLERIGAPMINIHHSFLPAFVGADPYTRAYERGVTLSSNSTGSPNAASNSNGPRGATRPRAREHEPRDLAAAA